jgi:hypothetical protein
MTDPNPHADLVHALGALTEVHKDGRVNAGQRRYTYMQLDDLLAEVRRVFADHNLAVMQPIANTDTGHLSLTTLIVHTSGHTWTFGPYLFNPTANIQVEGGEITYRRRYALAALVGLAGTEDDDGQSSAAREREQKQREEYAAAREQKQREEYAQTRPWPRVQQHATDPDPWAVHPITPHEQPERADGPASEGQVKYMVDLMGKAGIPRDMYKRWLAGVVSWDGPVEDFTSKTLTKHQVSGIITRLQKLVPPPEEGPL